MSAMKASQCRPGRKSRGMVLIAVLWIVAALSIAVTGLTRSVRQEAKLLGSARNAVQAAALGEAAIALVLQQMASTSVRETRLRELTVRFDGHLISVRIVPLSGLIDINTASLALLTRLFTMAGGLVTSAGEALAQATVSTRERRDERGLPVRFEAPEDLLQVPGFTYDVYAKIAGLVTADMRGSGKVNALAAPLEVLAVLANGNMAVAEQIDSVRRIEAEAVDISALDGNFVQQASGKQFRMLAHVSVSGGASVDVLRDVLLTPDRRSGAPWQIFNASQRTARDRMNP